MNAIPYIHVGFHFPRFLVELNEQPGGYPMVWVPPSPDDNRGVAPWTWLCVSAEDRAGIAEDVRFERTQDAADCPPEGDQ